MLWNSSSTWKLSRNSSSINSCSTLKLDFLKVEFQHRGISLNSFRNGHLAGIFAERGISQFWPYIFVFFFLYGIVLCFLFLMFNLLIGANRSVSRRQRVYEWTLKTLSNCALAKKSDYSLFCHSHFLKNEKAGLFRGLYQGIFVEDFPTFMVQTQ